MDFETYAAQFPCPACGELGVPHQLKDGTDVVRCPTCPAEKNPNYPRILDWGDKKKAFGPQPAAPTSFVSNPANRFQKKRAFSPAPATTPPARTYPPVVQPPGAPTKKARTVEEDVGIKNILAKQQELLDCVMELGHAYEIDRGTLTDLNSRLTSIEKKMDSVLHELGSTKDDSA